MLISIYGTRIKGINVARVLIPDIESLFFPLFFFYEMPKLKNKRRRKNNRRISSSEWKMPLLLK
jgi:hypothetical protein